MSSSSRHSSLRPSAAGGKSSAADGKPSAGGKPAPPVDAEQVAGVIAPVISSMGMDLEGVRVTSAGRRRLLRITVDADGGVSLDDIAEVSRDLSAALDDSAVMGDRPYTLEVSSPGVDRPLTERRHWRRAIGRLVVAPLTAAAANGDPANGDPANGDPAGGDRARVTVEGRVTGASADGITLDVGGESRMFGYGDLGPGKIKIEFAPIDAGRVDEDPDDEGADEEGSDGH